MGGSDSTTGTNNARYWDYTNTATSTTSGSTTFTNTSSATGGSTYEIYRFYREFIVTHHPFVTEELRARLTQIVNDETTTIGHVKLWIHGDVDVVDYGIEIRKWDDFLPLLRSAASKKDWEVLQGFLDTV